MKLKKIFLTGDSVVLKENFTEKLFLNYTGEKKIISEDNYNISELKNFFNTSGLFTGSKSLIVKNIENFKSKDAESIYNEIKQEHNNIDYILVISSEKKMSKSSEKAEFDEKHTFNLPPEWEENEWITFVKNISGFLNKNIEDEAIKYLLENKGKNDLFIYNELKKASVYASSEKITLNDVIEISSDFSEYNLEEIFYEISSKKREKAFESIKKVFDSNNFIPVFFTSGIYKYFMDMYRVFVYSGNKARYSWPLVKTISKESGVNTSRTRGFLGVTFSNDKIKKVNHEKIYDISGIKEIIIRTEEADMRIKSGDNPKIVITELVNYITGDNAL